MSEKIARLKQTAERQEKDLQSRKDELKEARRKNSATARRHDARVKILVGSYQLSRHGRRLHDLPINELAAFHEWLGENPREVKFLEEQGVDFSRLKDYSNGESAEAESGPDGNSHDPETEALAYLGGWLVSKAVRNRPGTRKLVKDAIHQDESHERAVTLAHLVNRRHSRHKAALAKRMATRSGNQDHPLHAFLAAEDEKM